VVLHKASSYPAGGVAFTVGTKTARRAIARSASSGRFAAFIVLAMLAVLGLLSLVAAQPVAAATGKASGKASVGPALDVVAQSSWVQSGQSFDLTLAVRSHVARSKLGIALSVYSSPIGQSSFDETLVGDTSDETLVSDTQTVPLSSLDSSGNISLQVGITAGSYQAPTSPLGLDLLCNPGNCNGVYPLRVQLMDTATGSVLANIVTDIVYVESSISSKLRVALVAPFGTAPPLPNANGALPAPAGAELQQLSSVVSDLVNTSTPFTLLPQPETLQTLEQGNKTSRTVADGIESISDEATAEILDAPYVWVDPTAFVDEGRTKDLDSQFNRGKSVLAGAAIQTSGNTTVIQNGLDDLTTKTLSDLGSTQLVVPDNSLVGVAGRYAGPNVQTFRLPAGQGRYVEAAQTDPTLQSELADRQGVGGVLAAHQLLADLALLAFEEPEAEWTRGVVLAPDLDWSPSSKFLTTLLSGLANVPVLEPVTLSNFFDQVSTGDDGGNSDNGNGWPETRQLTTARPTATTGSSTKDVTIALVHAGARLAALRSVVSGGENTSDLGEALLSTESVLLTQQQQLAAITIINQVVTSRVAVVSLTGARNIRLTAQNATIPITLVRQVNFPVTVVLDLSSDKLTFPRGTNNQKITLFQHVQSVDIAVYARTSGDFPVVISIKSPAGGLIIASDKFTVRSLSTSVVAIILTAGAAAILLIWWGRTFIAGRRGRKERRMHRAHTTGRKQTPSEVEATVPSAST